MRPRRGAVLLLTVFVLLALQLLAGAMLIASLQEERVARVFADHLRARLAAESAARVAAGTWSMAAYDDLLPGGRRTAWLSPGPLPGGATYEASVERLGPQGFLIRANGLAPSANGTVARARVGLILRGFPFDSMASTLNAAVTLRGAARFQGGTDIRAADAAHAPPGWPSERCADRSGTQAPGVAVAASDTLALDVLDATLDGLSGADAPLDTALALPGVPWSELPLLADRRAVGSVAPAPTETGAQCDRDAIDNWGNPLDPASACADYFPLIFSAGDLTVTAGAGQGVLIVDGDLTLGSGVVFTGVVVVRGMLVAGAAHLDGAVIVEARSTRDISDFDGTKVYLSRCALQHALRSARAFDRPRRTSARAWIPLF